MYKLLLSAAVLSASITVAHADVYCPSKITCTAGVCSPLPSGFVTLPGLPIDFTIDAVFFDAVSTTGNNGEVACSYNPTNYPNINVTVGTETQPYTAALKAPGNKWVKNQWMSGEYDCNSLNPAQCSFINKKSMR